MNNLIKQNMQDLFKNYKLQIRDYQSFNKSEVWSKILNNSFKNIDEKKLKNFFSNDLSDGIDNSRLIDKQIVIKNYLNLCDKYSEKSILNLFVDQKKKFGNPKNFYNYKDKIISYNDIFLINFYLQIEKYLSNEKNIILEIGGGYGGLARIFSKNKNCSYILIDLPEVNLISSYYLKSHFPEKKFLLYKDLIKNNRINIQEFDFIILPPWSLPFIENIKIDLFINIRSMMEMDVSSINKYFEYIQKQSNINSYFLNANRYYSNVNNFNFYFHKFPYDKKWQIIKSETSYLQENIHFLFTKRNTNDLNEIENLFLKLKKFTDERNKFKKKLYYKVKIFFKKLFKNY